MGLDVNEEVANGYADNMDSALGALQSKSLSNEDTESTITANDNCKAAYADCQSANSSFISTLNNDLSKLRQLAANYVQFDEDMAALNSQVNGSSGN